MDLHDSGSPPHRRAAQTHAITDRKVLRALDVARLDPPSASAMDRVFARVLAEIGTEERALKGSRFFRLGPFFATIAIWIVFVVIARRRSVEPIAWIEALIALVVAGACSKFALSGGRYVVGFAFAASAGLAVAASTSGELAAVAGIKCTIFELAGAAIPFSLAAYATRRRQINVSTAAMIGVAAAGALAAQAALHLTCMARAGAWHEWAFHFGPVLMCAAIAWIGSRNRFAIRA
jgi:hypothetical protein